MKRTGASTYHHHHLPHPTTPEPSIKVELPKIVIARRNNSFVIEDNGLRLPENRRRSLAEPEVTRGELTS